MASLRCRRISDGPIVVKNILEIARAICILLATVSLSDVSEREQSLSLLASASRLRPYIEIEIPGRGRRTTDTLQPGWRVRGGRLFATPLRHRPTYAGMAHVVRGTKVSKSKILSPKGGSRVFRAEIRLWSQCYARETGGCGRRTTL